ncbi:MAG: glyoxalase [Rhodospirillaceae bacterium]|nr:glyoxalase [Rhodospirillaceae bacterium]
MSRVFGELRQLGYVVRDVEAAMRYWIEVNGVGPFFYIERVPLAEFSYMGKSSTEMPEMSIALAFSGDAQVELIQQRNDAPSMYLDYLDSGQEGLQHIGYWPDNYQGAKRAAETQGLIVGQEGNIAGRGGFVYYQTAAHQGTCIEFAEYNTYRRYQFTEMARICRNWDGNDPIRTTLPAPPV